MIKNDLGTILKEIVTDDDVNSDVGRLVIIGSNSILSVQFLSAIEELYEIEIDNDEINYKFFSDLDYVESVIKKYLE